MLHIFTDIIELYNRDKKDCSYIYTVGPRGFYNISADNKGQITFVVIGSLRVKYILHTVSVLTVFAKVSLYWYQVINSLPASALS